MARFILLFCILLHPFCRAQQSGQNDLFIAAETKIQALGVKVLNAPGESEKVKANKELIAEWERILMLDESFDHPFDSVKSISILRSSDGIVRIYNWELQKRPGQYEYFGFIQIKNKHTGRTNVFQLFDNDQKERNVENLVTGPNNWIGAHYYALITTHYKKKSYYTLLGIDWNNSISRKKYVETLGIGRDGTPKFGEGTIRNKKNTVKRLVLEYSPQITASLRYNEKSGAIIMDHLVPPNPNLKGQYQFYGPDLSYDALLWKKGKWVLVEDYDARNEKNRNDKLFNDPEKPSNKPQTPILPEKNKK